MEFLMMDWLGTPVWFWMSFIGIVIALTAFDLGILHKEDKEMGIAESLKLSVFYIAIAMAFGIWVWIQKGGDMGMKYYTGYFIEKALSIDNVFVISLIFTYFAVPPLYQHRVLFWGILGVIVLRGIMIGLGATLVAEYSWLLYVFAAFLVGTGIKMLIVGEQKPDLENNPVLRLMRAIAQWRRTARVRLTRRNGSMLLQATAPMKRGEVWWVEFDLSIGSEIRKTRPAVILSNDAANRNLSRVVVIPLSSSVARLYPGEAPITIAGRPSKAMADQIMAADKLRLKTRLGSVSRAEMVGLEDAIKVHLALPK